MCVRGRKKQEREGETGRKEKEEFGIGMKMNPRIRDPIMK